MNMSRKMFVSTAICGLPTVNIVIVVLLSRLHHAQDSSESECENVVHKLTTNDTSDMRFYFRANKV